MIRSFAALAMLALLSGCAFTEDSVDIKYIPNTASVMPEAKPVVLAIVDGRTSDRNRISAKMNGFGMDMAPIRAKGDIGDIVKDALKTEFEERGFRIDANGRPVSVTINRFYNQFGVGAFTGSSTGDVSLTVAVANPAGNPDYTGTYAGTSKATVMMANGSNAAESVAAALKDAARQMFADPAFIAAITKTAVAGKPVS